MIVSYTAHSVVEVLVYWQPPALHLPEHELEILPELCCAHLIFSYTACVAVVTPVRVLPASTNTA